MRDLLPVEILHRPKRVHIALPISAAFFCDQTPELRAGSLVSCVALQSERFLRSTAVSRLVEKCKLYTKLEKRQHGAEIGVLSTPSCGFDMFIRSFGTLCG